MMQGKQKVPFVIVAGQTPPPTGGQNIMVERILKELESDSRWRTLHWNFRFTPNFSTVRKAQFSKVLELFRVLARAVALRFRHGRADLLLYPSGGPQTVPVVRDILLLPIAKWLARSVWVQFHAAGVADRLQQKSGLLEKLLCRAYQGIDGAIVMAAFNRCDPEALGIKNVEIIPHRIKDENPRGKAESGNLKAESGKLTPVENAGPGGIASLPRAKALSTGREAQRGKGVEGGEWPVASEEGKAESGKRKVENNSELCKERAPIDDLQSSISNLPSSTSSFRILYAGHLYDQKGTPQLVEAFAQVAKEFPQTKLVLMGEFLPPWSEEAFREQCKALGITDRVEWLGMLRGEAKAEQFRNADLFVFPTIAPYESFGLVMAEAMMWGLPIVATDWRGNRDVAGPDAWYCPVDSPELPQLAATLRAALNQRDEFEEIGRCNRELFLENFVRHSETGDYWEWAENVTSGE
jgi:glycosyltransferase involved in cell wall biosynthesis